MMRWLDRVTGRVTMYRLVLLALLAIVVEALLLSLSGAVFYSPLSILASAAVVVVATVVSSKLLALILRVKSHTESAIITGLILALIFQPTLDLGALGVLALAGVVASASKYLLAIRRRHVFNPAALAAFVVSLLFPANTPGWWVANPWLLPLVALTALVILYRTRHLTLGIVFVVLAATSTTFITLVPNGTPLGSAASLVFTSLPVVFFAGFMLSEPLTLPPRRWQQILVAVIAALLFGASSTIRIGDFFGGYPFALLVANAVAFAFGQRRAIHLEYLGRAKLDSTSWELSFAPRRPLGFRAGQYLELTLPHRGADVRGMRRVFSIASPPSDTQIVSIGMRTATPSSSFKSTLLALQPGDVIAATSIGGDFVLPRDATQGILLVAGGIGITPFISQLAHLRATGDTRDVTLVYAASSADDLAYAERLATGPHPVLLVAPTPPSTLPDRWTYLGAGPLTAEMLLAAIPDARTRRAYISGPPGLVRDLGPALRRAGVRRVHRDYFTGY